MKNNKYVAPQSVAMNLNMEDPILGASRGIHISNEQKGADESWTSGRGGWNSSDWSAPEDVN